MMTARFGTVRTDRKMLVCTNEVFALRDGESVTVVTEQPTSGRWFAVQARTVSMPDGAQSPIREADGKPVEQAAIIACQQNMEGLWQWMQLSPATKENIGDLLFDGNAEKDVWYYCVVEDLHTVVPDALAG